MEGLSQHTIPETGKKRERAGGRETDEELNNKNCNSRPPSVHSGSRVLGSKTRCSTQSPNRNLSELKGPTLAFVRIPEKLSDFLRVTPCFLVAHTSCFLVQGPSPQLPRALRGHWDDRQPLKNPPSPSSLVTPSPDCTSRSLETSHA